MPKVIQLSGEAYERLKMAKRPGESYSDVVLRLLPRGDLRRLALIRLTPEEERFGETLAKRADALERAKLRRWRRGNP